MRLGVSLCTLALVFAAGASPAAAQLPALPLPDLIDTVEETTKKVVEDTKKAVEDTERTVREVVDRTVHPPAPDPGGGSGGSPGGGGPGDNPGGGGPGDGEGPGDGDGDGPVDEGPGDDDSGGGPGGGRGSDGNGGSGPGAKDGQGPRETSGVAGGGEGGAALVVARPLASSDPLPPARSGRTDPLAGDTRDVRPSLGTVAAAKAGPVVLAVLALALLCLVVGTGGGLRALHGRLRGA